MRTVRERETVDKMAQQELLRQMLLIRRFEEKAAEMYMRGKIGGFLHLYIGEEAIAAGVMSLLRKDDYVITHYRDHGHALAKGVDPKLVMAELFGKATGTSKGKGGSMHLFDVKRGLLGGYAIVGGMLPIAVGLGLAAKMKGEDRLTVCFFGDGAVNQGEFHESLNLASLWHLPILFFCENNGYGMGSPISKTFSGDNISQLAAAYKISCCNQVDGMDVFDVIETTKDAIGRIRRGEGPMFIEALTYRFRGHSMADPAEYRPKKEEEEWRKKDPILHLRRRMEEASYLDKEAFSKMEQEVDQIIEEAVKFADESPNPSIDVLYEDIYTE